MCSQKCASPGMSLGSCALPTPTHSAQAARSQRSSEANMTCHKPQAMALKCFSPNISKHHIFTQQYNRHPTVIQPACRCPTARTRSASDASRASAPPRGCFRRGARRPRWPGRRPAIGPGAPGSRTTVAQGGTRGGAQGPWGVLLENSRA